MTETEGEKIIGRMMHALGTRKKKVLASALGIDASAISQYLKADYVPENWYATLTEKHGLDLEWLRTGEGEPTKSACTGTLAHGGRAPLIQIPLISSEFNTKGGFKPLPANRNQIWITAERARELGEIPERLLMLEYRGNHMTPYVENGDMVIFDQNRTHPEPFELVVARIEDTMNVYRLMVGAGDVIFSPSIRNFPSVRVPRERLGTVQAEILGMVVGLVRLQLREI
jgi:SOS-response transcriptional repressor LexA